MELQPSTPPVRPFPISIVSAEPRLTEVIAAVMKRRTTFGVLGAGWKSGGELYLYDIHTSKKSSLNKITGSVFSFL